MKSLLWWILIGGVFILDFIFKSNFINGWEIFFCFLVLLMVNDFNKSLIAALVGGIIYDFIYFSPLGLNSLLWLLTLLTLLLLERIFSFSTRLGIMVFSLASFVFLKLFQGSLAAILYSQIFWNPRDLIWLIVNSLLLFILLTLFRIEFRQNNLVISYGQK